MYDNNNRGAIWRNDKKEKDTHPDFTGSATIDGVDYWVSAWKRKPDAKPSSPALSFSVKPKEQSHHQQAKADGYQKQQDDFIDSDIPF